MTSPVKIVIYGSLKNRFEKGRKEWIECRIEKDVELKEIFKRMRIPKALVQIAMVNHRAVGEEAIIRPGDRVALFPMEYPFFADWHGYRFR